MEKRGDVLSSLYDNFSRERKVATRIDERGKPCDKIKETYLKESERCKEMLQM